MLFLLMYLKFEPPACDVITLCVHHPVTSSLYACDVITLCVLSKLTYTHTHTQNNGGAKTNPPGV